MRTFIAGDGSDSTAAVLTYLASHRQLYPADLYVIGTAPSYQGNEMGNTFLITDYPSGLVWSPRGSFIPGNVSRNEVESKIGLEAQTIEVTWSPQNSDILTLDYSSAPYTVIEGFEAGIFDDGLLEVWRCLMPTPGDAATLGCTLMFSGRIGNIVPDRLKAVLSVINRMETLNEQVPTNLIEPTNILSFYTTGQVLLNGPQGFTLAGGSTSQVLVANPTSAPGGYTPENGSWDDGYVVMTAPGKLGGAYRAVREQTWDGTHHTFYLYWPLPFTPAAGDTFDAFILVPPDQAGAGTQMSEFDGFPYVPSAIDSAVVIA